MYCPNCNKEFDGKFCPECGTKLIERPSTSGFNINLGDANAISGGINMTDSHNVHNEDKSVHNISNVSTVTNNVTQVAAQKTEMELIQEKKSLYLNECKRAYEDNVLEQSEVVALEEFRIKIGLDRATADAILDSVRIMTERNAQKTVLNPIAKAKLKILTENLQKNEVKALMDQIDGLEALVNKYDHEELSRKYFLVLAALKPEKCIGLKESSKIDSYWMSFWSYLAYIKVGRHAEAENVLVSLDRFADYPEDNIMLLGVAGALMKGNMSEAKEYLESITGDYTSALQRFVDSLYLLLMPEMAKEMSADANTCAFYLVNFFGSAKAKEEARIKDEEEARIKAEKEVRMKAEEEARVKAEQEARMKAKEEALAKAKKEARMKAEQDVLMEKLAEAVQTGKISTVTAATILSVVKKEVRESNKTIESVAVEKMAEEIQAGKISQADGIMILKEWKKVILDKAWQEAQAEKEALIKVEQEADQKPHTKTLHISVGGQRGQMLRFHRLSPDNELYERAQELIEEKDQSEIEEFVNNFEEEDFEYDIQPLNDSGMTWVRVTDEDGNVIFDDEVEVEQGHFNGNPHNWSFDDSVSVTMANRIKSLIDERYDKAYASYAEDADCTDEEKCRNDFWEEECDIADEITAEMLTDVLKVNSEKDSDDMYYIWGGDLYGFSYDGEIHLLEDEKFDVDKLRLFLSDYDSLGVNFNEDDCLDSVLPVIQYGNTFSQLYIGDWEIHYPNAAFCTIEYGRGYMYLRFL